MAAVNGISAYVPPAHTRRGPIVDAEPDTARHLREADVVLGVARNELSPACENELNRGLALGRNTVAMAYPALAHRLQQIPELSVIAIDPSNPAGAEERIVSYLKGLDVEQSTKTALLALGTIALGLLIFAPQD